MIITTEHIGHEVHSAKLGIGTINDVDDSEYPVQVQFSGGVPVERFTREGRSKVQPNRPYYHLALAGTMPDIPNNGEYNMELVSPKLRRKLKAYGYNSIALDPCGRLYAYMAGVEHLKATPYGHVNRGGDTGSRVVGTIPPLAMEDADWVNSPQAL